MSLYKVDKNYSSCNLKTTELLECALIGVCAVIRLNKECSAESQKLWRNKEKKQYFFIENNNNNILSKIC